MRLLHTSDWHLGHTLRDVERSFEHQAFLDWLLEQIVSREVDALLIAGDVFDASNPPASAQEMWYSFLARAVRQRPGLQIVAIAGNHDSAARLEAPDNLLRGFHIRVVGTLPRNPEGAFYPEGVLVRLNGLDNQPAAVVVAMPFLREGDLPEVEDEDPLIGGVRELYRQAIDRAREENLPMIAMGHCYMMAGQVSEASERKILKGNLHALPVNIFPEDVVYAALGHLHLPQSLGQGRVHYSGSPLPLSMTERLYPHAVSLLEIGIDGAVQQETLRIPRTTEFLRIPEQGFLTMDEALAAIGLLEPRLERVPGCPAPFTEVAITLPTFEPGLRTRLQEALETKGCFLASLHTQTTGTGAALADASGGRSLHEWSPEEIFRMKWQRDFQKEPESEHLAAFHELIEKVSQ